MSATSTGVREVLLLDTDLCLAILKGDRGVLSHLQDDPDPVAICFATVGELFAAAYTSTAALKNNQLVQEFLLTTPVVESNNDIAARFGRLRNQGSPGNQGSPDRSDTTLYIAAAALSNDATLLTGRPEAFQGIPELKLHIYR